MAGINVRTWVRLWVLLWLCPCHAGVALTSTEVCPSALTAEIPRRAADLPEGAAFAATISGAEGRVREEAIARSLLAGNLPDFLRRLQPVTSSAERPGGGVITATLCVMPDYLAVGSNRDFMRIPMDLHTATTVAARFGFVLPTRRIVDAIYRQSAIHFEPQPLPAGPRMRSTAYYLTHDRRILAQAAALDVSLGTLLAGHKKDLVMSKRLLSHPGRIAIYGWHRRDGRPIQPLSTVHGAWYADYSHGIRLVSDVVIVDGRVSSIYAVLSDPRLAAVLSDEGPLRDLEELIPQPPLRVVALEQALRAH